MTTVDHEGMRIPDAIEPIVAFRCWSFTVRHRAGLFPLTPRGSLQALERTWIGAERDWVVARCRNTSELVAGLFECVCDARSPFALTTDSCSSCEPRGHAAPDEDCHCGFYATRKITQALRVAATSRAFLWLREGTVLGRVALAGKVIEHDRGYRAERARVLELIPLKGREAPVVRLASELGLPLATAI